jgi:hypothetical protein
VLEPQSRQLLLDSLHPPEGHRLDWAVGTTYSLDLLAILSAPVAFAFSDWHDQEGRPTMDPLALLKAVRQYADRICLFCQAGKIHVPRSYQPLLANLEESIVQAVAPRGGTFHPKVWFLRYASEEDGSVTYRVLCLSRNMTFDRSWDTMLCLEGSLRDRVPAFGRNHPLGQFVEALPKIVDRPLSSTWQQRLNQLAYEIRRVEFEVPAPFDDIAFWVFGIGDQSMWPFPDRMDQVLVISPFVDDGFLEDLAGHQAPMQLVSRPESLALIQPRSLGQFQKVWILDDTVEPETGDVEETEPSEVSREARNTQEVTADQADIPLVGLHAKVYVADVGWNAHVWTGSANATKAAMERNVEMLVQLTGKRSACGVDATLGQPNRSTTKRAACLADLLRPYETQEAPSSDDQAKREFERKADLLACSLAASEPVAQCCAAGPDSFTIMLKGSEHTDTHVPAGWELRAWPISLHEVAGRLMDPSQATWVTFEKVSFEGLTSFFAFEIASPAESLCRRFVLNIPLLDAPTNRRETILRTLLSDPDRVLRFLLLLLMDHDARDFGTWFSESGKAEGNRSAIHSMFESTLFESLVRALDREPTRLDHVSQVIHDLSQTPEGRQLLPKGFEEIWAPVWEVRKRQREQDSQRRG